MSKRKGALSTFLKSIQALKPKDDHTLFFRGHSNKEYIDIPSIYRFYPVKTKNRPYVVEEDLLFRKIIMACPNDFNGNKSTFDSLVKMQHYGLPTRLLDITSNPLVALYFACKDSKGKGGADGEVIVYEIPNHKMKFYSSDTVSVVSNIAKRPNDLVVSELKKLERLDFHDESHLLKSKIYNRLIHDIQEEKPYFKKEIVLDDLESVVCVQPKLDNKRIIKQSGSFLLFGIDETKLEPANIPSDYYKKDSDDESCNIIIVLNGKDKILRELESLSISEATLFPEIENVATHLKTQIELKFS